MFGSSFICYQVVARIRSPVGVRYDQPANPSLTLELLTLTAQIVAANRVPAAEVPALINSVYGALATAGVALKASPAQQPAVPIKGSIQHDHLVCLEDGTKLKVLTRYLSGLT